MSGAFGQQLKEQDFINSFITSPAEFLVLKTLQQMAQVKGFKLLFGPLTTALTPQESPVPTDKGTIVSDNQRWADYDRRDWSIRQLPVINIFEAETEDKTSRNAWLHGTVNVQVYWPPNFRRSDLARVPMAFRGALLNFFESKFITGMLDELYFIQRPEKVPGLNEYGKVMTWSPNVEALIEDQLVPVSLVSVRYRIDLRAWYRAMEFDNRTTDLPFDRTLADLVQIGGEYDGVLDDESVQVVVPDEINVESP